MKNTLLFILTLFLMVYMVIAGYPMQSLHDTIPENVLGIFRIVFCLILFIRIIRSFPAIYLLHGYKNPPKILFFIHCFATVFVGLGVYTDISAIILFFSFVGIYYRSNYFSIEEIYFQNTLFHLPFMGLGSVYSIDSFLGSSVSLENVDMFNAYLLSNCLIMLSAGYEKSKSKIWQKGEACRMFVGLPHLVKPQFHFLHKLEIKYLWVLLTYIVLLGEFLMPFALVNKYFMLLILVILIGFSINLFTVIDISFIGQVLFSNLIFIACILWFGWENYPSFLGYPIDFTISSSKIFALISILSTTIIIFYFNQFKKLSHIQHLLTGVICPIGVFNERHQFGFYTYRIFLEKKGLLHPVLETFEERGFPGKYQTLFPRYFQGAMYPVTDYCLALNKYNLETQHRKDEVIDLLFTAMKSHKLDSANLVLKVKKYDIDDNIDTYSTQEWKEVINCQFQNNHLTTFDVVGLPPTLQVSFREV